MNLSTQLKWVVQAHETRSGMLGQLVGGGELQLLSRLDLCDSRLRILLNEMARGRRLNLSFVSK